MKFIRFFLDNQKRLGILSADEQQIIEISTVLPDRTWTTMPQLIESITAPELARLRSARQNAKAFPSISLSTAVLCAPIERPIHDILCVGVNYRAHLQETKEKLSTFKEAAKSVYFSKRAARILGSGESIQSRLDLDESLDYEAELAVIIGKRGMDIPKEHAEAHIFGYSIFNDLSSRKLQTQHNQWFRGKSLDTYAAMGPVILHKSALPFPIRVAVISRVNGELRQNSNTEFFLADIPSLIADLSCGMTLEPGDIIATGTPAGVGMGFTPPRYLKKGDTVVCEIPPIGQLCNTVE